MKRLLLFAVTLFFLPASESFAGNTESEDGQKAGSKRVRIIALRDGVTVITDTLLTNEGSGLGSGGKYLMFVHTDSIPGYNLEEVLSGDTAARVIVRRYLKDTDTVMKQHGMPSLPRTPGIPDVAAMQFLRQRPSQVIDLSDPSVVSFKKKKLKNGQEKITIVREVPPKGQGDVNRFIIQREGETLTLPGYPPPAGDIEIRKPGVEESVEIDVRRRAVK